MIVLADKFQSELESSSHKKLSLMFINILEANEIKDQLFKL